MEEDDIVAVWSERIRTASADGRPLRIRGGGTKDWYGQGLEGEILDTRAHRGIIAYDPAELVITARAGTPLAALVLFLIAVFPANAYAARHPQKFGAFGTPLIPRALLQLLLIALCVVCAL